MDSIERRKHNRIDLKLDLVCKKIATDREIPISGQTLNVSTGGVLAHISNSDIDVGEMLSIQISVPPTEGLLDFGGRMEGFARIVRLSSKRHVNHSGNSDTRLAAMQFCHRPKLSV